MLVIMYNVVTSSTPAAHSMTPAAPTTNAVNSEDKTESKFITIAGTLVGSTKFLMKKDLVDSTRPSSTP